VERVHAAVMRLYKEFGENAAELGKQLGVSRVSAGALVAGTHSPSMVTLERIAKLLNQSVDEIRTGKQARMDNLEVALAYHPGRWMPETVEKARAAKQSGERHTPQGWAAWLDKLEGIADRNI
jgi:DNA-binding XRE family transcriptional regulator